MKIIRSNAELEQLHSAGEGLIYNDFSRGGPSGKDYNVLHAASCSWVVRSNVNVPKYFFGNIDEATKWLRENRGEEGKNWKRCGTCQAKSHSASRVQLSQYPPIMLSSETISCRIFRTSSESFSSSSKLLDVLALNNPLKKRFFDTALNSFVNRS